MGGGGWSFASKACKAKVGNIVVFFWSKKNYLQKFLQFKMTFVPNKTL